MMIDEVYRELLRRDPDIRKMVEEGKVEDQLKVKIHIARALTVREVTLRFPGLEKEVQDRLDGVTEFDEVYQVFSHILAATNESALRRLLQPPVT